MQHQTRTQAVAAFGRTLRQARTVRDSLPPREAALLAYTPGGPSVDEIEATIRAHRAEARTTRTSVPVAA